MTASHLISCTSPGNIQARRPQVSHIAPLVLLDLGARLAAPVAVLAFTRSQANVALVSSALVAGLAGLRALVLGRAQELSMRNLWDALVDATRARSVPDLRMRSDEHGAVALIDAAAQVAHMRAGGIVRIIADAVALVAVLVATVVIVGPTWVALGVVALACGAAVFLAAHRRTSNADRRGYLHFARAAHDFEVLLDAATELRAHGCESRLVASLRMEVERMAAEQRRAATYSALAGLFPFGVVLLVAIAPFGLDVGAIVSRLGGNQADLGVLAITGLVFGHGLARSIEGWARSAPQRHAVARYCAAAPELRSPGTVEIALTEATIELAAVSVEYPGAARATPADVSTKWRKGIGLALTGPNGSGKSTLALCLLGLIRPTSGCILFDGVSAHDVDWDSLRQHVVYVPQDGFLAGDRSIEWQLELLASEPFSTNALQSALVRVGLWSVLEQRAERLGGSPFDVPASQLSGGERKRLQLARTILGHPQLIVLDEPEAALDEASRRWLCAFLEELSQNSRVLVIAHDPAVIPPSFERLECHATAVAAPSPASRLRVAHAEMPAR